MDLTTRSAETEIMDDLSSSGEIITQTLKELEFINKWLGGNQVTLNALSHLFKGSKDLKEVTIADLGCGGGDMLRLIHRWAKERDIKVRLIGIDANPNIIEYAKHNLSDIEVHFYAMDIFSEDFFKMNFDVVIGTLFFHHFTQEQLTGFFSRLKNITSKGIIINDIHRHFLAYHSIRLLTSWFSKSSMVIHDAPLSVRRAFKKKEIVSILEGASLTRYSIHWKWAFRWQVVIRMERR